ESIEQGKRYLRRDAARRRRERERELRVGRTQAARHRRCEGDVRALREGVWQTDRLSHFLSGDAGGVRRAGLGLRLIDQETRVTILIGITAYSGGQRQRRSVLGALALYRKVGDVLARPQRHDAGVLTSGHLEQIRERRQRVAHGERRHQLHVRRLRHAHLLKEAQLVDVVLVPGLKQCHLLLAERDFSALNVEQRSRADLRLCARKLQLDLRVSDERIVELCKRETLQCRQVILPHRRRECFLRTGDIGVYRGDVGALHLWCDERRPIDAIVEADVVLRLHDVTVGAQRHTIEEL